MPTGYTSYVDDGCSFQQFVWLCARAFGACVLMRDDNMEKLPPEGFPVSDYHPKQLVVAEQKLAALKAMTTAEVQDGFLAHMDRVIAERAEYARKKRATKDRYERMLSQVQAWNPPSSDHSSLRDFMIEQLKSSIDFDCKEYDEGKDDPRKPEDWHKKQIDSAIWSVNYHKSEYEKEKERVEGRNQWLKLLRESVPMPITLKPPTEEKGEE